MLEFDMAGDQKRDALQPRHAAQALTARRVLESDIGLDTLAEALELVSFTDPPDEPPSRERQLLERMSDPAYARYSITQLMKDVGLTLAEVLDLCRKRDIALAVARSGARVGSVLDGLGEAAEPRWEICATCGGDAEVEHPSWSPDPDDPDAPTPMVRCPERSCQSGKIRRMGNLDAAKLFLGVHGLVKGGGSGAPTINVNTSAQAGVRMGEGKKAQDSQESVTSRVQAALEGGGS
jgi:hypothetical protein